MEAIACHHATKLFYEPRPPTRNGDAGRGRLRVLSSIVPRRRKVWAVKDVSFGVEPGEVFGVLGPNGSGKSTLIRLIATLLVPDQGSVRIFGHDVVRERRQVRRLINRVSVDAAFFKKLSAWENLSYASRLYGIGPRRAYKLSLELLESFGFDEEKLYRPVENLSRGMQQKVSIARALLTSPKLLLLDEPTTGLDPRSKTEVQAVVRRLHAQEHTTILLTSHDMDEVESLCDRVAIINEGRLVALDTVPNLKREHAGREPEASLEDVFLAVTGTDWEEALASG